ncbi:MAG: lytM [Pseudomonas sp.]|jgi:murein DD-endopeptidase MepM/ murein hydrolase activator NlpD|uniref:peptidoglycan DD-metalloendopeptidase family protein n=1 Tax=Pseudomonas sp. TaxID=306 RepID=UPI002616EF17|nr:peptidoglycan DD-metalloendopeptidase family protein [Pseudomonas sp.]MDB6047882.1 lytM [Pseudomonas sp.]
MLKRLLLLCVLLLTAQTASALTIYKFTDANGVVSFTDRPTPGATVVKPRERIVEHLEQQVHLQIKRDKGVHSLFVRNDTFAPVEVELQLSAVKNVLGITSAPIHRVVPARSNLRFVVLSPLQPGKALSYTPKLRYSLGDPERQPFMYSYPLPWKGGPFRISQGPNGKFSHFGVRSRYAMDIAMPEGTPIIAARSGTVIKVENGQSGRGSDPSGNFVRILHDDGTMGVYLHLMRGSVSVKEGQRVAVGTDLARSGNTGNSTGPHLHFVIQRNAGLGLESIPYQFAEHVDSLPNFAVGGN